MIVVVAVLVALLVGVVAAVVVTRVLVERKAKATEEALATATQQAVDSAVAALRQQAVADREEAVRLAVAQLERLAEERLRAETEAVRQDLEAKRDRIDQRLDEVRRDLSDRLSKVSEEVAALNTRSAETFGEVAARLRAHAETTSQLAATTQSLREALANPKARGQWGERMAEDVLRLAGFVEGVNYHKQKAVEGGRGMPDYTFPLPKGQVLYMDVKFPLTSYLRYLEATTDAERSAARDTFLRDVKARVTELARREYADKARGSLDYVLLFLPNESITAFIHEQAPSLVDEALAQKVVLCSPLTLFAMLGVIRQAYDNFLVEQTATEMLQVLGAFKQQYEKFIEALEKLGRSLDTAKKDYDTLAGTRRRQLERPLDKLEQMRQRRNLEPDTSLLGDAEVLALPGGGDVAQCG